MNEQDFKDLFGGEILDCGNGYQTSYINGVFKFVGFVMHVRMLSVLVTDNFGIPCDTYISTRNGFTDSIPCVDDEGFDALSLLSNFKSDTLEGMYHVYSYVDNEEFDTLEELIKSYRYEDDGWTNFGVPQMLNLLCTCDVIPKGCYMLEL